MTFPANTRLLLARDNSELKIPEVILQWRNDRSVSEVALVRQGSTKPIIVAADYIKKVFWYPDRTKLYGYTDHTGRFHPLPSERHSNGVLFWLEQFEKMDGIEEFYLLDGARYAVVKRSGAATGAEAVVLERRGPTVATLEQLCHTNSAVQSVVEGPNSFLFIPRQPPARTSSCICTMGRSQVSDEVAIGSPTSWRRPALPFWRSTISAAAADPTSWR